MLRTRLLVWNTSVIVLLLAGFAFAMVSVTRARLTETMDREMRQRAQEATRLGPPPPGQRMRFPQGQGPGGPPGQGFRPGGPEGPGPPPDEGPRGRGDGQFLPVPQVYRDANRLADIRRPRFVGVGEGDSMWSDPPFDPEAVKVLTPTFTERERLRILTVPVVRDGQRVGSVQVAQELDLLRSLNQAQWTTLAVVLPASLIFVLIGAWFMIDRALRPVDQVTRAAATIGAEDLSKRLPVTGDDELARMAGTFNDLLGRLESAFAEQAAAYGRLQAAFDAQQRFTADASHELRTPLTRVRLALGNALNEPHDTAGLQEAAAKADATAAEMSRLVEDLLTLARTDAGVLALDAQTVDLRVPVADGMDAASAGPGPAPTGSFPDEPVMVKGDESLLKRVVVNLVGNARRHTPDGGEVHVTVDRLDGWATVTVRDTGEGIPEADLPHIFDRFYRSDEARTRHDGGTGLGLAITKGLVEAHKGKLDVASQVGNGTVVRVLLPLL
ncbi:MAG: HAMP domain-containing histidine kinase [Armatimonadetes bacterium]|nr:HAMP domain-containing histidine kinase [Armatimonadota bacterium]